MIKYLELTAPESMTLKGAKIIQPEVAEGDTVEVGDALFTIQNDGQEVPLPASKAGKVVELIAREGDGVSLLTPLLLLETEVESSTSTATPPPANKNKNLVTVKVPDIGGDSAKVVEILVSEGDTIGIDDPVVTLESDKASMEVPNTAIGVVHRIIVALDTDVSQGDALIEIERTATDGKNAVEQVKDEPEQAKDTASSSDAASMSTGEDQPSQAALQLETQSTAESSETSIIEVPDIGDSSAKIIEILVKPGDTLAIDDPIITLESDKASMEVPSTLAGTVEEILIALDQDVTQGTPLISVTMMAGSAPATNEAAAEPKSTESAESSPPARAATPSPAPKPSTSTAPMASASSAHASPSVRRFARELGADLGQISGSGRKGRITKDDVKSHVKQRLTSQPAQSASAENTTGIPRVSNPDFAKFGEIETQPLNRIKQLTATNLHRSWLNVPHVTHHDEANIDDLESFRKQTNAEYQRRGKGLKLSPLAFIVKAVVNALQNYPQFNSSLSEDGKSLILKKYFNIGIAVDTPEGLVVPVIKEGDKKSAADITQEMGALAAKARDKKLSMADMSGACFTISSLGGIGGTSFTPIVNAPEVAILGVSRTKIQPHWNGSEFVPAPFLPLSLSYDHRVIDGAEAARFTRHIADVLEDVRRLTI